MSRGFSTIVGPEGNILEGLVSEKGRVLDAELDVAEVRASRRELDVVGHYARRDVFTLTVDTTARSAMTIRNASTNP